MEKIYIVVGSTGQTDDYREWMVIAYADQTKAIEHATNAKRVADEIYAKESNWRKHIESEYDHYISMDYNGVEYRVKQLDFIKEK